jgi:hypothetical protein
MGLEASHFIGEISVGIIELYNIWYTVIYIIINYNTSCMYIGGFHASQVWWHPWVHAMKTLLTFAVGICILQPMWKMRRPSTFHREKKSSEQNWTETSLYNPEKRQKNWPTEHLNPLKSFDIYSLNVRSPHLRSWSKSVLQWEDMQLPRSEPHFLTRQSVVWISIPTRECRGALSDGDSL